MRISKAASLARMSKAISGMIVDSETHVADAPAGYRLNPNAAFEAVAHASDAR